MDEPPGGVANGPQQAQAVQGDGQPQEGGHPQPQGGAQALQKTRFRCFLDFRSVGNVSAVFVLLLSVLRNFNNFEY